MQRIEVRARLGETNPYEVVYCTSYLKRVKTALDSYVGRNERELSA